MRTAHPTFLFSGGAKRGVWCHAYHTVLCRDSLRWTVDENFSVHSVLFQAFLQNFLRRARALAALGTGPCFACKAAQGCRTAFYDGMAYLTVCYGFTNTDVHDNLSFFRIEAMGK